MVFLNPLFLWTLLGLSIPIAIHFWSKKKVKTIKIGSTKLLRELDPKQTRSISLNQWFLLLLRMMIITLLALILSGPRLGFLKTEKIITYLVEPSLLKLDKVNTMLDTISDSQIRLLEPGFPLVEDLTAENLKSDIPNYWQLAHQMEALEADSIIVLTKGLVNGFKGMRPSLEIPVHWLQLDPDEAAVSSVEALLKNDELVVTSIKSDQFSSKYISEIYALDNSSIVIDNKSDSVLIKLYNKTGKLPLIKEKSQRILIISDEQLSAETIYISSALDALSTYLEQDIIVKAVNNVQGIDLSSFDVLVWLKQVPVISFQGKTLLWEPDDLAEHLIEQGTSRDQYLLRHHLNAENSLDMNLPRQLLVLLELHQQLPDQIENFDLRAMHLDEIQVNTKAIKARKDKRQLKDVSPWIWSLLLIVLPVERILSKYRKQ